MGLIHYEQLEDGFDASANLWNERFGILFNEINGNLDTANIKNGAITSAKLAPSSVTSDKLSVDTYIDDNGWTVTDYGSKKSYRYQNPGNIVIGGNAGKEVFAIPAPQGISSLDSVFFSWSVQQVSQEVIYTAFIDASRRDKVIVRAYNTQGVAINGHPYIFDFVVEDK